MGIADETVHTAPSESCLITTGKTRLNVDIYGAPDAPPLVLLHGFTGSARSWGGQLLGQLAQAGMRVLAFDLPGHGNSNVSADPADYSLHQTSNDVSAALYALHVSADEAILLGYSMGGRIALYLALSGYFRGLVLESASPGLRTETERAARRAQDEALAENIIRQGLPSFVEYWEQLPLFATQRRLSAEQRDALHAQRLRNHLLGLANSLRGVGTGAQPSLWEELGRLTTPTLLVVGADDPKFSAIGREMLTLLPEARMVAVPAAGHTVHLEQPTIFQREVLRFCRDSTSRVSSTPRRPLPQVTARQEP